MTYSIVGLNKQDHSMGFASQSQYFAVGAAVGKAEAGVGIVVSQAFPNSASDTRDRSIERQQRP